MMKVLIVFNILFALSCSRMEKVKETEDIEQEINQIQHHQKTANFGPTLDSKKQFIDVTAQYGLEGAKAVAFYAVDLNFDTYTDLVLLPDYFSTPVFYLYSKEKKQFLQAQENFFPSPIKVSFLAFADINNDGVTDVITAVLNQKTELSKFPLELYYGERKNDKLTFNKSNQLHFLPPRPTSSVSYLDFNLDGKLDFFIGNWFQEWKGKMIPTADQLILQNEKGFEDKSIILKGETNQEKTELYPPFSKPTYGSATCDIDQNGYPDILTVSSAGYANKLWMNNGVTGSDERVFEDVGIASGYGADPFGLLVSTGGGRSFFSACTDYNDDGIMDIFLAELTHAYDHDGVDRSSVLSGSKLDYPPSFLRTEYLREVQQENWNQGDKRGVWWDYNYDTRIDLLVDNSGFPPESRLVLFEQDETKAFSNVARENGIDTVNPTGTILLDINNDGKLDILTGQNNIRSSDIKGRVYLFENNQNFEKTKIYKVVLEGTKSNRDAIGSFIQLYYLKGKERIVQKRWYESLQGGLPSQHQKGFWFAVPQGYQFVGFKVRWPTKLAKGSKGGSVLEKMYSIDDRQNKSFLSLKLCENGDIIKETSYCPLK
jgi:hypothetical protein